ncbi:MAG TPA: AAA family ATPase [Ktedonobacterales bacterium]|nr:AAA family ATPase [Ktedonobacterales bacterium]
MATETPNNPPAARRMEIERAIDRVLDDSGHAIRDHWRPWAVALVVVIALWYLATHAVAALLFLAQVAIVAVALVLVVVALLWLLDRGRVRWSTPSAAGLSLDAYKGATEAVAQARQVMTLLRGADVDEGERGPGMSRALLLVGPHGVGKRYLAQCLAAEAHAPLATFSAADVSGAGSRFGLEARAIRSLYRVARRRARGYGACVIFIDEPGSLSAGARVELLRQLDASALDDGWWARLRHAMRLGRSDAAHVLTIGATSDASTLDPTLLAPGHFDHRIRVAPPNDAQRAEVIAYYLDRAPHDEDIALPTLVAALRGDTAAAIARVIAEAATLAHADGRDSLTHHDIIAARAMRSSGAGALSHLERRRMAYRAAGRAVAQASLLSRNRVASASLLGGVDAPAESVADSREVIVTQTEAEVFARIEVALASRAAEDIFLRTRLDASANDLAEASRLALRAVAHWGMGETLLSMPSLAPERLEADPELRAQAERLLRHAYADIHALLEERRNAVVAVADALQERDALSGEEIEQVIHDVDAPNPAQIASQTSVAEAALFGAHPAIDFQAPAPHLIGPVAATTSAASKKDEVSALRRHAPTFTAPVPPRGPSAFAASPSQELRADRVIDRAILRAPLRQTILQGASTDAPAGASVNGANGASGATELNGSNGAKNDAKNDAASD